MSDHSLALCPTFHARLGLPTSSTLALLLPLPPTCCTWKWRPDIRMDELSHEQKERRKAGKKGTNLGIHLVLVLCVHLQLDQLPCRPFLRQCLTSELIGEEGAKEAARRTILGVISAVNRWPS